MLNRVPSSFKLLVLAISCVGCISDPSLAPPDGDDVTSSSGSTGSTPPHFDYTLTSTRLAALRELGRRTDADAEAGRVYGENETLPYYPASMRLGEVDEVRIHISTRVAPQYNVSASLNFDGGFVSSPEPATFHGDLAAESWNLTFQLTAVEVGNWTVEFCLEQSGYLKGRLTVPYEILPGV